MRFSFLRLILDAAIVGQLRLVKMLVERGADPCFKNRKGKTPCDVAAAAVHNFLITARGELAEKFHSFSYNSIDILSDQLKLLTAYKICKMDSKLSNGTRQLCAGEQWITHSYRKNTMCS